MSFLAFLAILVLFKEKGKVKSEHNLSIFRGFNTVFSNKQIYVYLLMGISGLFGFGIFYSFVPTKSQLIGINAWQIGMILSSGAVIFTLISYTIGIISDKLGRKLFAVISQVIIIFSGIGLMLSNQFVSLLIFYGLFCIGETITYLLSFVYAADIFQKKYVGTSMGIFDSMMDLSLFLGPLIAISLYKSMGSMKPIFLIAVVPAVIAFFVTAKFLPCDLRRR